MAGFINADGNLIIPWDEWGQGYVTNVVIRFSHIDVDAGATNKNGQNAYVDLWGEANNVKDMPLSTWFGCTYKYDGWHYMKDEPTRPYGQNVKNYALKTWCNKWPSANQSLPDQGRTSYATGYTRVGDFVKYVSNGKTWQQLGISPYHPESWYTNSLMPQFKRCVAEWQTYWRGANVYQSGDATAWIYGRPYESDERQRSVPRRCPQGRHR